MRVRIVFSLENRGAFVPFHYQFMIDRLIKKLLSKGERKDYVNYDLYNFSSLKGKIKVGRGGVHFCSYKVTLVFATSSKSFMDYFIRLLFDQSSVMIGSLKLVPEETVEEPEVSFEDSMQFLCISPIILQPEPSEDELRFISPETDEFSDLLYESTIARMEAIGGYGEKDLDSFYKFQLVADKEYIYRMEEDGKKYSRICPLYDNENKMDVRIYTFPFTMYAPRPVQKFIYENGIGHFCNQGFGMVDLVDNRVIRNVRDRSASTARPSLYL